MTIVECDAKTCAFYKGGVCISKKIELVDFEYYLDKEMVRRDALDDDMKCITYQYNKGLSLNYE
ncbi:DUF1540 domain-containing protein [Clostridium botulinum]|nr:DUF1540 domain-containing protein [Clostridium botulinum]NFN20780.1 DUF1540 domain-containing protein [Clostridium botulinum]NFN41998.1 DUF1540 domain-containing protein [Clostridium botulinum]